jgi:hypothetical protein
LLLHHCCRNNCCCGATLCHPQATVNAAIAVAAVLAFDAVKPAFLLLLLLTMSLIISLMLLSSQGIRAACRQGTHPSLMQTAAGHVWLHSTCVVLLHVLCTCHQTAAVSGLIENSCRPCSATT